MQPAIAVIVAVLLLFHTVSGLSFICGTDSKEREPLDVILALDYSGSMLGDQAALRKAAKDFIDMLEPGIDQVGLVLWSNTILAKLGLSQDYAATKQTIDDTPIGGQTYFDMALANSIDLLDAGRREMGTPTILFFSDGSSGQYTPSSNPASQTAKCKTKGYTIYPVGLGTNVALDDLKDMADATGGTLMHGTADELDDLFTSIHSSMLASVLLPMFCISIWTFLILLLLLLLLLLCLSCCICLIPILLSSLLLGGAGATYLAGMTSRFPPGYDLDGMAAALPFASPVPEKKKSIGSVYIIPGVGGGRPVPVDWGVGDKAPPSAPRNDYKRKQVVAASVQTAGTGVMTILAWIKFILWDNTVGRLNGSYAARMEEYKQKKQAEQLRQ